MHLNDSIGTSGLHYICTHHEQAAAMAAEGYARITSSPGVLNVTTGPGGINALNGVFGAWTDSVPLLVLSGQVKRATCSALHDLPGLRTSAIAHTPALTSLTDVLQRGLLVPFINASATGLIAGALWLRRGQVRRLGGVGRSWVTSVPGAVIAATAVAAIQVFSIRPVNIPAPCPGSPAPLPPGPAGVGT